MRNALVSLIAAGAAAAVSVSAFAQESTPAVPPVPTETPAAPADQAAPQAEPSTAAVPAVETPAPVAEVPPAPIVEAPPPPPPAPAVPTDPAAIRTLSVLENVCKPQVEGGDFLALTKSMGFKKKREVQTLAFAKPGTITVSPPGSNKNVCLIEIEHAIGSDKALTVAVHDWAVARGFSLYRNDEFTTDLKRHTRSWEVTRADGKAEALVLITSHKPDGSPLARNADKSTLMYSVQ
jgi:hypothetical protein